jgi:stage II sporulation protein AA (anti-sigma F factor antagonist)
MDIAERRVGGVVILDLKGRLILSEGEHIFRQKIDELIAQGHRAFLVNFDNVTYVDSAGVGVVVWKYVTLKRQGGSLKLLNLHPRTFKVFAITKLLTVLEHFDSEAAALKSFESAA